MLNGSIAIKELRFNSVERLSKNVVIGKTRALSCRILINDEILPFDVHVQVTENRHNYLSKLLHFVKCLLN